MIGDILYVMVAIIGFLFGGIYLFKKKCMPYHIQALDQDWNQIPIPIKTLCLALMRVAGGGYLSMAITISFFIGYNLNNNFSGNLILFSIGLAGTIPSVYATLFVKKHTKGEPPTTLALTSILLLVAAFISSTLHW
ncbi:hypothetical protein EMN47_00245 [Prolixibacteraceae bacterium JC049]|nr:hypothetical protein [Prolixibacteraceae bacterium JC049]